MCWKPIPGFSKYEAHPDGKIRNIKNQKELKISTDRYSKRNDYVKIVLCTVVNKKIKRKTLLLHRIIALTFIENINEKKNEVNHKDKNKYNNKASNLEWMSHSENVNHSSLNCNRKKRKIGKYTKNGKTLLKEYSSVLEAARENNISRRNIYNVCKGNVLSSGGYFWKFLEDINKTKEIVDKEKWKVIKGYENYLVSKEGEIYSLTNNRNLKQKFRSYYSIILCKNGKPKNFQVHRLVAMAFIPNPENKKYVDHIDTNPKNNNAENLRWSTCTENMNNPKSVKKLCRKVKQLDKETREVITVFNSLKEAALVVNGKYQCISAVCRKQWNNAYGYGWEYVE